MKIQKYKFINSGTEKIWKKELKLILNRDIHESGLGCLVKDTHMKIGDIHLGDFFEAQFLFGNAYWISVFSNALKEEILKKDRNKNNKLLIIGYETYIEPVALQTKDLLREAGYNVEYCIYEGPKYILFDKKSSVRIRFCKEESIKNYDSFIIISGISSSLSTYKQIITKMLDDILTDEITEDGNNLNEEYLIQNTDFFSVIQVLPNEFENGKSNKFLFEVKDYLENDYLNNTVYRNSLSIKAKYFVSVFCEWQNAKNCRWCFEKEKERPLVTTNETSVIPVQMIGSPKTKMLGESKYDESAKPLTKINFFERDENKNFIYLDYLYYNHIERGTHHYQYYVRTNSLLKKITEIENEKLNKFCKDVRSKLIKNENEKRIDVLVVPVHYSNEMFFNIISKRVFNSCCEIITVNPKKEFRSNFETKYSNYAYIFDAIEKESDTKIYFHYVDDQLITGMSYFRMKSFISSLLNNSGIVLNPEYDSSRISLFESVIIMLNRNSNSTKLNYVKDLEKFFSLIDIDVPFLRNYGDSCYLCAKTQSAKKIKQNSAHISMSEYWYQKELYNGIISLDKAKIKKKKQNTELTERKFRRFYCDNLLWSKLRNDWSSADEVYEKILEIISKDISQYSHQMQYEYIISFVKILARPFLNYRENIKKAILAIMLYMIHILNTNCDINPSSIILILKKIGCIDHKYAYKFINEYILTKGMKNKKNYIEKYYLYIILLSNLSNVNSNYIISSKSINKAMTFYNRIIEKCYINEGISADWWKEKNLDISQIIYRSIKNVTNGVSGNFKALKLDEELEKDNLINKYPELVKSIYLENLEAENRNQFVFDFKNFSGEINSLKDKYKSILQNIVPNHDAYFIVNFPANSLYFLAKKNTNYDEQLENELRMNFEKDIDENEIIIKSNYFAIKCCNSLSMDMSSVYLIVSYAENNKDIFAKYKFIRSILCYRYQICTLLEDDIRSGSIKALFNDDKWMDTLSQPKAISHGQSEDIKEHFNVLNQLYYLYNSVEFTSKNSKSIDSIKMFDIYSEITLFSNLLISHYHLNRISNEMGKKYKFKDQLRVVSYSYSLDLSQEFSGLHFAKNGKMFDDKPNPEMQEKLLSSLKKIENESPCLKEFLEKFEYYIKCVKHHIRNLVFDISKIKDSKKITSIINPLLIDSSSIWFSIALIHILIKNAEHHGVENDPINISFEENEGAFDLIVQNTQKNSSAENERGITQLALRNAFEGSKSSIEFNSDSNNRNYIVRISKFFMEENR